MSKPRKTYNILSDEQVQTIILGTIAMKGRATEDDIARVCEWADNLLIEHALLQNVLEGNMGALIQRGQPVFQMLPKGNREVEAMLAQA